MFLLDDIHRTYVNRHKFNKGEILAIKSVAGSGKTTTLLNLAKIHKTKKILYVAFNKSLITEIKNKIFEQNITNLYPQTFDSLLVSSYSIINNKSPSIKDLNAQKIGDVYSWLKGKPFRLRNSYVKKYREFCDNPTQQIVDPSDKVLTSIWQSTLKGDFITFNSLRKLSVVQKWFKESVDTKYDMIMIDETQDFDIMMLRMLLDDTTIPKIFVGDPKQSIYQWRGCINGFKYMPESTLIIEFYSTFRVGDPACETIREQFDDCWMISKSKNTTTISNDISVIGDEKYTYLFRTWRHLLTTAEKLTTIWINSYDSKIADIRRKHAILSKVGNAFDDDEFEDDLPKFLKSISQDELEEMITNIEVKLADKDEATCKLYTVHGYKGLEDNNIRIASDIEMDIEEEDMNVYYVALTRGMKHIIMDSAIQPKFEIPVIPKGINLLMAWKEVVDTDVRRLSNGLDNVSSEFINHPYVESGQTKISDFFPSVKV
jgi:energy-coupling factor transporter ATP-binding protein EcfA2